MSLVMSWGRKRASRKGRRRQREGNLLPFLYGVEPRRRRPAKMLVRSHWGGGYATTSAVTTTTSFPSARRVPLTMKVTLVLMKNARRRPRKKWREWPDHFTNATAHPGLINYGGEEPAEVRG